MNNQYILATPDPAKCLCVYKDESSTHWSGVFPEVDPLEVSKSIGPPQEWDNQFLSILRIFSRSLSGLSKPRQKYFAIFVNPTWHEHILAIFWDFIYFIL